MNFVDSVKELLAKKNKDKLTKAPAYVGIATVYAVESQSGDEPFHLVMKFEVGTTMDRSQIDVKICSPVACKGFRYTGKCHHLEEIP